MATNGEKLTFYTTPATYVGPMRADHTTPYARVIGIRAGNIALMCADVPPAAVRDETVIRVEPLFCTRLLGHFAGYHLGDIGVPFNCHLTAAEVQQGMIGSTAYHDTLARADTVMRDGVECDFSAGLPLGVQGIIGDRLTGEAYHSVTGLGETIHYSYRPWTARDPWD